jgi:cytochrome bd-type quinol oxidase subunit 1
MAIPKFKVEFNNYYMLVGWILIFAGVMGILFYLISPNSNAETILGFAVASIPCGLILLYLGYTKKTILKRKK